VNRDGQEDLEKNPRANINWFGITSHSRLAFGCRAFLARDTTIVVARLRD